MERIIEILQHKIEYWYQKDQEMPDHEQDHVKQMIIDGYCQGQLVDTGINGESANIGWWSIVHNHS